jgi:hypothetical protein
MPKKKKKEMDVFGISYEIVERYPLENDDGECCPNTHEIRLKKTIRDKKTLVHELVHGMIFEGALYCALNEKIREVVAEQVAEVITRNFHLRLKDKS